MTTLDPDRLADARLQIHWATQALAATCDALLERRSDDGQSSLLPASIESERHNALVTRSLPSGATLALRIDEPELLVSNGEHHRTPIGGKTLNGLIGWIREKLPDARGRAVVPRDYAMPAHPVGDNLAFDTADTAAFAALADRLAAAWRTLGGVVESHGPATELLLWPHHFDIGAILLLREGDSPSDDPCVGIGYTPGDDAIPEPYYYANPYAVERPEDPPALGAGHWTAGWFGAVLTESDLARAEVDPGSEDASVMARTMIEHVRAFTRERASR